MHVLHVYSGNLYGGVETLLVTLARARRLVPSMRPSFALCFESRLAAELEAAGTPPARLGAVRLRAPRSVLAARRALDAVLAREKPDVVCCHSTWPLAIFGGVARARGVPVALYLHDRATGRTPVDLLARRVRPDVVICNSAFTAEGVPALWRDARVRTFALPVAAPEGSAERRDEIRRRRGVAPNACVIVQASRMQGWKGQRLFVEAFARLARRSGAPELHGWLAGGAQRPEEELYEDELRELARALGVADRISFLGQRSDVPELLAAADVYCQPNLGPEPFGIAFVEALYAGLPVVTTRMGGPVDIVTDDVGALVEPDAASVERALARYVTDPELRGRTRPLARARAHTLCEPRARMLDLERALESAATETR